MLRKKNILLTFLIVQIFIIQILKNFPEQVEHYYSNFFFRNCSLILRAFLGNISISVGDSAYFLLIILVVKWFWQNRNSWHKQWKNNLLAIMSCFSVFYFFFHLFWGFNYYRQPLVRKMELKTVFSDADLIFFIQKLIQKTNAIQFEITQNRNQKVIISYTQEQIFIMNIEGYKQLSLQYPFFSYNQPSIKKSLFSLPLSYMGFGGYLNPFTVEAQINDRIPMYGFSMTVAHEMAHQLGYASESECNFIGFLASIKNDDLYCQYSGYSYALRHCLLILRVKDPNSFKALSKQINKGILFNFKESDLFWQEYQTPIEEFFKLFYDSFLKINQQKEGLHSYSQFIDLLVNYEKSQNNF